MKTIEYTITDALGIHARPAGLLVKEAGKFASKIMIASPKKEVDAKRIMGVMGLGVKGGDTVKLTIEGVQEIKRVLKDDGTLIAPTFTHAGNSFSGKVKAFFMKLAGFPLHSRWTSAEYLRFLSQNGWTVRKSAVLKASFPLTYAECVKSEV